jgi:hypothetical protein
MLNLANPPQFDPEVYTRIHLNELVVYSMHFLSTQGIPLTSEDIVSACFTLFPKRFSLLKYPYWPDSASVSRRWSDCRRKGYLVGSAANSFKLTPKGMKFAEKVEKMLGGSSPTSTLVVQTDLKTRAGKFVRTMETSDAYRNFKRHGKSARINEYEFRSMLLCTLESTPQTLNRNLELFREYVQLSERKDLQAFLDYCELRFAALLGSHKKPVSKAVKKKKGKK